MRFGPSFSSVAIEKISRTIVASVGSSMRTDVCLSNRAPVTFLPTQRPRCALIVFPLRDSVDEHVASKVVKAAAIVRLSLPAALTVSNSSVIDLNLTPARSSRYCVQGVDRFPGESIEPVDEQHIEGARFCVSEGGLQPRPV